MAGQLKLSRRGFLQGIGAGAVGISTGAWLNVFPALAQTSGSTAAITAFSRFNIGTFEVTVFQDAVFPFDPAIFAANATPEELAALIAANNYPEGTINATVNIILVNTGDSLILLDTGNGAANGGRLLATMELLGVAPADINAVVLSHFHPDHIGGAVTDGAATFPNATYYFPQAEWDFIQNPPAEAADFVNGALASIQPIVDAGNMLYYAAEGEILPGIVAVAAPGHTPGHSALQIVSEGAQLLNVVDAALNNLVSLARTDWYAGFDSIPDLASETRRALLTRAAEEGLQIFGYHFPFPGVGYVVADGDGFRFVPAY